MNYKIVLAEDESQIAKLTKYKLEQEGYDVIWENNGLSALNSINTHKPDLVILDVMMPGMDGFQVLKKIKEDENLKRIPVIMLTVLGQDKYIKKGKDLGAQGYMVKPFRPAELATQVKKILEG